MVIAHEAAEAPASGGWIELVVFDHDVDATPCGFSADAGLFCQGEEIVDEDGTVGEVASLKAGEGCFVCVDVVDAAFGRVARKFGADHSLFTWTHSRYPAGNCDSAALRRRREDRARKLMTRLRA